MIQTRHCGTARIVKWYNNRKILIEFDNTGTRIFTRNYVINNRVPNLKDPLAPTICGVACVGIGQHLTQVKRVETDAYRVWRAMIYRCYQKKLGYTVCDEWLNYQNFAAWYYKNKPDGDNETYHIKTPADMIFSPESCGFLAPYQNYAHRKKHNLKNNGRYRSGGI